MQNNYPRPLNLEPGSKDAHERSGDLQRGCLRIGQYLYLTPDT